MARLPRELSKYRLNIRHVLRKNGIPLDLHDFGEILAKLLQDASSRAPTKAIVVCFMF